ncbi:MAG: twin-arginine translocase subunit TatC, partial [Desulfocucumaceae bacterium]
VSFFCLFLLPFGLVFQMPLAALLLGRLGLVTSKLLREKRKYVILGIFVLAAVLSPGGDLLAQILFALPMLVLYEISIVIVALTRKRAHK